MFKLPLWLSHQRYNPITNHQPQRGLSANRAVRNSLINNPTGARCNLCGENRFRIIEEDQRPQYVIKCLHCGLIFVDPFPAVTDLSTHYDEEYYAEWLEAQSARRLKMWRRRLEALERRRRPGCLLDVGCATGTFLQLAQDGGWEVRGTEFSAYAAKYAGEHLKADIFCGELVDARYEEASFDAVTFWHVLEHVTDPTRTLEEAHRILKPSGLLVIAVPNVNDLVMRATYRIVKGKPLRLFTQGEREIHLFHFSADTLQAYLQKTGFDGVRIIPDYGITDPSKKLVNAVAVACSYLTGRKLFNALEAYATRS
jgi:2-polyprenyl-3-methyl-5-hydroxy-6-metoxy-1,4-benzoquinol methylase